MLLGLGLYIEDAALVAVIVFVLALICLLAAAIYYAREVSVALGQAMKTHSIYASWISNKPPRYPSSLEELTLEIEGDHLSVSTASLLCHLVQQLLRARGKSKQDSCWTG